MICNIKGCSYSICGVCNNMNDFDCDYKNYRAIGTIEEIEKLKKEKCIPIATIKFSKDDLQKMIDEKVQEIQLEIKEIRSQAIDELVEKIRFEEQWLFSTGLRSNDLIIALNRIYREAERIKEREPDD